MTIQDGTISEEELLTYFTPVWIQYLYNETSKTHEPTFHEAVPCTDVSYIDVDGVTSQTYNEIKGQYCANRGNVYLQGGDTTGNNVFSDGMYYFAVDTCEHMKSVTGNTLKTECKTQEQSIAIIDKVYIQNKISTQFFSPVTYLLNDNKMNSEFLILFHQIG